MSKKLVLSFVLILSGLIQIDLGFVMGPLGMSASFVLAGLIFIILFQPKRVEILTIIQIAIIISLSILLYTVRFYQIEDIIYVGVIHALLVWLPLYIRARML